MLWWPDDPATTTQYAIAALKLADRYPWHFHAAAPHSGCRRLLGPGCQPRTGHTACSASTGRQGQHNIDHKAGLFGSASSDAAQVHCSAYKHQQGQALVAELVLHPLETTCT